MDPIFFTKAFLIFLFIKTLVESFLDKRNFKHIIQNRNSLPSIFWEKISLENHRISADYALEKIKVAQFFHLVNLIILLGFTLGGGLEILTQKAIFFSNFEKGNEMLFIFAFLLISTILTMPEAIYSTFVIEEKYGFNKTTWKTFILDLLKGALLSMIIGAPVIYGILTIMEKMGQNWWLYAFLFLTTVQLTIIFIYPTMIAPLFNKFSPIEEGEMKDTILNLLSRLDLKSNGIFMMDASLRSAHGNAYFTGFGKTKRIVFFDTLLKTLSPLEVEAVLAHEIGHMKKKHIIKGMLKSFAISFLGLMLLGYLKNLPAFFIGHGLHTINNANILILFSMVSGIYTFLITPISSFFQRKYEYEADQFAADHSSAQMLISALIKMYNDNKSFLLPDPLYSKFYYSHPPAMERINFLISISRNK